MAKDVAIVQAQRLSGNVGDVLTKTENGVKWQAPQGGIGTGLPDGGTAGQYLRRTEDGADWLNASWSGMAVAGLPDGGGAYDVLALNSDSEPVWSGAYMVPDGGETDDVLAKGADGELEWRPIDALPDDGRVAGRVLAIAQDGTLTWKEVDRPVIITTEEYSVEIDPALDASSSNPVQNKVVYAALQEKQDLLPEGAAGKFLRLGAGGPEWADVSFSCAVPADGTAGKYLRMTDGGPAWRDASWSGVAAGLPEGGTAGQVLARTSDSYSWIDALELPEGRPGQVLSLNEGNALVWRDVSFSGMVDDELDASSSNPVKNKAIYAGLERKQDKLPEGDAGKYLRKTADGVEWSDVSVSVALPDGGEIGDVLTLDDAGPVWAQVEKELPDAGRTAGKVLTVTSGNGVAWESARYALDLPLTGGVDGQLLQRDGSDTVSWVDAYNLPYGRPGQVLVIGDDGKPAWADPSDLYGNGVPLGDALAGLALQVDGLEARIAALEAQQ